MKRDQRKQSNTKCSKCDKVSVCKGLCVRHYQMSREKAYGCPHVDRPKYTADGKCFKCYQLMKKPSRIKC